jgi:hypothetical protein
MFVIDRSVRLNVQKRYKHLKYWKLHTDQNLEIKINLQNIILQIPYRSKYNK